MNFFDAQDQARRATRWLVIVYVVSTLLIVAGVTTVFAAVLYQSGTAPTPSLLAIAAFLTTLVIIGSSIFKTALLSGGGGKVAEQMGGTLVPAETTDPLLGRLRNVVEEMSIASGVPVPDIYVLEKEQGINAFAAGFTPGDAAVAVTRGTLEILDRDELQGVIAHEFSHILNGDMRLNIRMMGVLFGIMVVGLIGRTILRGGRYSSMSTRRSNNASGAIIVGLGLTLLGWIGVFFSRVIKAAVSRQREFLADASAVQFTRQADGIANALKKIGGYKAHSYINSADPEEVSHMLFAGGLPKLASLFATHPPLTERIRALQPAFTEADYPHVERLQAGESERPAQAAGFAAGAETIATPAAALIDGSVAGTIGRPTAEHLGLAQQLHRSIPQGIYKAAHSPSGAYLLTIALIIDPDFADRQFTIIESKLGDVRALQVREYYEALQELGARYWLPILEIAFPALRHGGDENHAFLVDLIEQLAGVDGQIDLREYCFYRIISAHLAQAAAPSKQAKQNRVSKSAARRAAVELLRIVADQGNDNEKSRKRAFNAGLRLFGDWAGEMQVPANAGDTVQRLDSALDVLRGLNSAGRKSLVEAVAKTIAYDDRLTLREAELLRTICATLDCPLPPVISMA
jgi:Zn-dependent protease with chaperone function